MTSPASSETPKPASLPGLGTTWYQRGTRYWLRRAMTAVLCTAVMAFVCFVAVELYQGFRSVLPQPARTLWDAAQAVAACVAVVWGWLVQRRSHRKALLNPPTPGEIRARKRDEARRAPGLSALGRLALLIAAPVVPAVAAFALGWASAMLTVREYPSEVGARRAMTTQA